MFLVGVVFTVASIACGRPDRASGCWSSRARGAGGIGAALLTSASLALPAPTSSTTTNAARRMAGGQAWGRSPPLSRAGRRLAGGPGVVAGDLLYQRAAGDRHDRGAGRWTLRPKAAIPTPSISTRPAVLCAVSLGLLTWGLTVADRRLPLGMGRRQQPPPASSAGCCSRWSRRGRRLPCCPSPCSVTRLPGREPAYAAAVLFAVGRAVLPAVRAASVSTAMKPPRRARRSCCSRW